MVDFAKYHYPTLRVEYTIRLCTRVTEISYELGTLFSNKPLCTVYTDFDRLLLPILLGEGGGRGYYYRGRNQQ